VTTTKALTKTTNCRPTFKAKNVEGTCKKKCRSFAPDGCPNFQIRSGVTAYASYSVQCCKLTMNGSLKTTMHRRYPISTNRAHVSVQLGLPVLATRRRPHTRLTVSADYKRMSITIFDRKLCMSALWLAASRKRSMTHCLLFISETS